MGGDGGDFEEGGFGKARGLDHFAGGDGGGEDFGIELVDEREVIHVGDVEGGFEDVCDETSFTSLLVLEGKGTLTETATGESLPIQKGESFFIPAGTGEYTVSGTDLKCLRTRV